MSPLDDVEEQCNNSTAPMVMYEDHRTLYYAVYHLYL